MKNRFCLILILFLGVTSYAQVGELRTVTLEWDSVADAKSYEIEIRDLKDQQSSVKITQDPKWKGQLVTGDYEYRIRAVDERRATGRWTEWTKFALKLPWPKVLEPGKDQKILSNSIESHSVKFRWKEVSLADKYYFEIRDAAGRVLNSQLTRQTELTINLPVGQHYLWAVTSLSKGEDSVQLINLNQIFQIQGAQLGAPEVNRQQSDLRKKIVWDRVEHADEYIVKLQKRQIDGNWKEVFRREHSKENSYVLSEDLGEGEFRISLQSQSPNFQKSSESNFEFVRKANNSFEFGGDSEANSSTKKAPKFGFAVGGVSANYQFLFKDKYISGSAATSTVALQQYLPLANPASVLEAKYQISFYNANGVLLTPSYFDFSWTHAWPYFSNLVLGAGLVYIQSPIVESGNLVSPAASFYALQTYGPRFLARIQASENAFVQWRIQVDSIYNAFAIQTPNNGELVPTFGYNLESRLYLPQTHPPVFLSLSYLNNFVSYLNSTGEVNSNSGQNLKVGTLSYSRAASFLLMLGIEVEF